ncbi:NADPH-dependent glutamate synthase [Eubacterium sp. AB3007]|uniref:NADPH-dependent glutamate synthase n=1 Tax=Eubacterium sp. AB3007 TaxID=1392487 RepID=UPI000489E2A3|nr:NADPH-dependent glutamate synthase [Eubacterium sp. AB3007]MBQ1471083.1 NADPH-dependent glutamate synthase [Eubacterium sp.]
MINLRMKKNPMPEQDPMVRNKNFLEVTLGYTPEQAISEAMRCLKCRKKPCMGGCPVMIKIPDFVAKVAEGDFEAAYQIISEDSSLPAICGRVCPQENQCEGVCVRGTKGEPVSIGRLERFVADWHAANFGDEEIPAVETNGHKVAIIGAGPAGLACAGDLINKGYEVTVFESLHKTGGVLVYGIPQFRLPKEIVAAEVSKLEAKGVKFVTDAIIGRAITVDELIEEEGFESVFIGTGAGLPSFMHIPGENLLGVVSANEYLTRINLMKAYRDEYDTPIMHRKKIAVVGGGNVAMDAARCAKRMGAEDVYIIYRRSADEIPARAEEIHHAVEEGVIFHYLTNPVQILDDGNGDVKGIECVKMELGEPDASGRRRPVEIEGSNFVEDVDYVIMAIGTKLNTLIIDTTKNLEANARGGIGTDDRACTNRPEIFAGGDAVTGAATVIKAMGAGKVAAAGIDEFLSK